MCGYQLSNAETNKVNVDDSYYTTHNLKIGFFHREPALPFLLNLIVKSHL